MSRRVLVLVISLCFILSLLAPAVSRADSPPELTRNLLAEGDRWFARGQYRTAARLYQAAARSLGDAPLPPAAAYRWGVSAVSLGEYRTGAEQLGKLAAGPQVPGLDPSLLRLYLGLSLVRLEQWTEALSLLRGLLESFDREDPGLQVGFLLAGTLVQTGDARAALVMLDRLYQEAGSEAARRRVVEKAIDALTDREAEAIVTAVGEGILPDPAGGLLLPWLETLIAGGRSALAERVAAGLVQSPASDALRQRAAELETRARVVREQRELRIGVLVPLTGDYQFFGKKILQAYNLALQEYSGTGATLVVRDTGGDPETARRMGQELIDEERVKAVLGPILSTEVEKVVPLAGDRKVPVLSPAAQAAGLRGLSPWFFRTCITLQRQAKSLAQAAVKGLGITKFAILSPGDNYGKALSRAFWDEVTALGGRVLYSAQYGMEKTDFNKEIKLIRGEEEITSDSGKAEDHFHPSFEAVYIPDTFNRVGLIAPQLSFHDIERQEVILLGSSGLNTPEFARIGEEYVEGTIFLDSFLAERETPAVRRFVARYRARYEETPDVMAAQAYDAASILFTQLREGKREPEEIRRGLASLKDFPGVCGLTSMDPEGEVIRDPVFVAMLKGRLTELVLPR